MPVSFSLLYYLYRVARDHDSQSFGTLTGGRILVGTSFVGALWIRELKNVVALLVNSIVKVLGR